MLTVVGIGPGASEYLTFQAHQAISQASILVGGARQLALFPQFQGQTRLLGGDLDGLIGWLSHNIDSAVVVLASGDPWFMALVNGCRRISLLNNCALFPASARFNIYAPGLRWI